MKHITFIALIGIVVSATHGRAEEKSPVNYHISFNDMTFLDDCYVARSRMKTPEERKLELVHGRFGNALYLGAVPLVYDADNLSGIDLDLVTAVIYNVAMAQIKGTGYDEPFIWGAGKLHPAYGSLAFWVKGPNRADKLFNQSASSFGRLEKELLQISLKDDGSISAYVEDTRYVQHTVCTSPVWKANTWNHIVFMWDRSSGLSLWINGKEEASSMGTDAWWDNQRPSLFHLPMSKAAYDEFYIFNRPLTPEEISDLYKKNKTPEKGTDTAFFNSAAIERLKKAFCADVFSLPILKPSNGTVLVFHEITPERIHDESMPGWWLCDGRYECAWPHEYSIFTIVPGDADFHAEKADILPPVGANVNYLSFEGNLDEITVFKGDRNGKFDPSPVVTVPRSESFFYGTTVENLGNAEIRIPFTKSYGTPPGFKGDAVKLPLSGDLRLHEVGLFNVSEIPFPRLPGDCTFYINQKPIVLGDKRYSVAMKAFLPTIERTVAGLYRSCRMDSTSLLTIPPMTRLNLLSEPFVGKSGYESVIIDMWITSPVDENLLIIKILDPAVPSHLWSHAEMRLLSFTDKPQRVRLALNFDPIFLVEGDRLWLQLLATEGLSIVSGDTKCPAEVTLRPVIDWALAEVPYSYRTMYPTFTTYSKMFEYMPWRITNSFPDVDAPENFNGPFDMVYPWQAVLKVNPSDRLANIYKDMVIRGHRHPTDKTPIPSKSYNAPSNAPSWAVYFHKFQSWRDRIITWWRHNQRSDGQVGGGWNDDTLVFSSDHGREGGYSDMILDSNPDAQILYNNVVDGFDKTNLFKDGYCRIYPIDRLHNGDFVRERYKSLIYNLGDPRSAVWAMEEAWHWEKPEKTPVNYGDGTAFLFGKNVLEWYWNWQRVDKPYKLEDQTSLIRKLRRAADACNDTLLWRFTEARVHTDDQSPYGSDIMHYLLNGSFGERTKSEGVYFTHVTITLGIGWIAGGGADLARLVEYSGNDGLSIQMYSFDEFNRIVTARLYRLDSGEYTVTLRSDRDGNGGFETLISEKKQQLKRFDRLTLQVPSKVPVILEVKQIKADPDPGNLPDLATSEYCIKKKGDSLIVTVHNIGCASSGPFTVNVLDLMNNELKTVNVLSLESAEDFVPKHIDVCFPALPSHNLYRVRIDREDRIREIFEENNKVDFEVVNRL